MKTKAILLLSITAGLLAIGSLAYSGAITHERADHSLTTDALSKDERKSEKAIAELRAMGPAGLEKLMQEYKGLMEKRNKGAISKDDSRYQSLIRAIDAVGQQRDCLASQLYWHTDFEKAKAASKATGKPILSLRLLGNLDEEFSCANSRFFRTTLYANAEVSKYLREHFILHWKSVRPVPRMTIDFGDGRKIERTITGNSIHYVLDSNGRPIDALPGLYGAKAFLAGLKPAEDAMKAMSGLEGAARETYLSDYHSRRFAALREKWNTDYLRAMALPSNATPSLEVKTIANPNAFDAGFRAFSKGKVEMPVLNASLPVNITTRAGTEKTMDDPIWSKIARLYADDVRLDETSKALIQSKNPTATAASKVALMKSFAETPLLRVMRNLETSIAEDTVRNEYLLHSQIHRWFIAQTAGVDVDVLNSRIYADLFLTPDSDPWLGLVPSDAYSALPNDGFVQARR